MVMAGTAPSPATDISLSARLQWLQQRREQLQEKLALKNNELKNLCLDEAELTGILPPEIPLEPGESPPAFRKRVGTCFTYPQNLINRLKTNEAEESSLELERQVQVDIAESSLRILNDPSESKTVRRKHRSMYQQSQRRLRELDARLSFIRQAYGRIQRQSSVTPHESASQATVDGVQINAKHRTKKPRPPLDNLGYETGGKTHSPRSILQESGVSLSPLGIDSQLQNQTYRQSAWSSRGYRSGLADEDSPTFNLASDIRNFNHTPVGSNLDPLLDRARRRNVKYSENDLNDNHDVYILPDRYRQRTYSQGNNPAVNNPTAKYCQDGERAYRTIPNTYTEEERQIRYRQMQQKRHSESQNSRHNIGDQQHTILHKKPPVHHNYSPNYQQQPSYLDNQNPQPGYYQSDEFINRTQTRYGTMPEEHRMSQRKNSSQSQHRGIRRDTIAAAPLNRLSKTNLQESTRSDGQLAAGYWTRENDEIVWCPEELTASNERFGSLDRRKYRAECNTAYNPLMKERGGNQEERERYGGQQHNVPSGSRDYILGLGGPSKYSSSSASTGTTSHHQNYNSQVHQQVVPTAVSCYERISPSPPPPPRTLLRTQSLGSVETWQQQQSIVGALEGLQDRESSMTNNNKDDGVPHSRAKEKEWYETSMDSSYSVTGAIQSNYEYESSQHREGVQARKMQPPSPHQMRQIHATNLPPEPPPLPSPPLPSSNSREITAEQLETRNIQQRRYMQQQSVQQQQQLHPVSPKSLEIPAESKRRNIHALVDEQQILSTNNSDRSPDICTIVQAGKYQPYREVTKPFEMSDFYKYSTKFRKRNEATAAINSTNVPPSQTAALETDDDEARRRNESRNDEISHLHSNPAAQRRVYEPVQRMSCQPFGNMTRRQAMENEEGEWRGNNGSGRPSADDSTVV